MYEYLTMDALRVERMHSHGGGTMKNDWWDRALVYVLLFQFLYRRCARKVCNKHYTSEGDTGLSLTSFLQKIPSDHTTGNKPYAFGDLL